MNDVEKQADVLGPLPLIPGDEDFSQRLSVFSEIYEEIVDPINRFVDIKLDLLTFFFISIFNFRNRGSGIYEEMKLSRPPTSDSPPPLPPRTRKNTDCSSLQRSYTTPESEMAKKKWNLFENVFGRSKTKRRERPTPQPRELQLLKAKRNSFSSPDLSHLDNSLTNCADCSFELPSNISSSNSWELENLCEDEEHVDNISHQIQPNFELKLDSDMSSVNLVGSNYNLNSESPAKSPPGYLEMRPGRGFDMQKVKELDTQLENDVLYRLKYSFDSPITYRREFDYQQLPPAGESFYTNDRLKLSEPHYVCMTMGKRVVNDEPTYMAMTKNGEESQNSTKMNGVRCKRHSVDDKIASYYPSYDVPTRFLQEISTSPTTRSTSSRHNAPVNRVSPNTSKISPPSFKTSSAIDIPQIRKGGKRVGSFNMRSSDNNNNGKSTEGSKKYATLSRITGSEERHHHLSPAVIKKSGSISPTSIKRFASLPRFKKIDFAPLRMKISSVLQRGNSGGC